MQDFGLQVQFEKADPEGRFVRGFASVISVGGAPVTDLHGDQISMQEITQAAHQFILNARVAQAMHNGKKVGDVVESVVIDDAFAEALKVADPRRGWWIGMEIYAPEIQAKVRDGSFAAFSIGGRAERVPA